MPDQNIEVLKKETYIKMVENAVGSRLFNSMLARFKDTGAVKDILNDGEFSCAFFVSSILALQGLIDGPHTTVETVRQKLKEAGWREVKDRIEAGDIIFWEKSFQGGTENEHIGFAIGANEAISTSYSKKAIVKHHIMLGLDDRGQPKRKVTGVFRLNI